MGEECAWGSYVCVWVGELIGSACGVLIDRMDVDEGCGGRLMKMDVWIDRRTQNLAD